MRHMRGAVSDYLKPIMRVCHLPGGYCNEPLSQRCSDDLPFHRRQMEVAVTITDASYVRERGRGAGTEALPQSPAVVSGDDLVDGHGTLDDRHPHFAQ